MIKVFIEPTQVPLFIWIDDVNKIEQDAINQAINLASLPFAFHHSALMPDAHLGEGSPIGMVFASDSYIIPNVVGVDIGCGMHATKTDLKVSDISKKTFLNIIEHIKKIIPVGFSKHEHPQDKKYMPDINIDTNTVVFKEYENALKSIGTLGGGNHFIELQKDKDENLWIMLHSGSRNLGHKVATHYNKLAIEYCTNINDKKAIKDKIPYLKTISDEAKDYINEMDFCIQYAFSNRQLMMNRICEVVSNYMSFSIMKEIDIAHNFARLEHHYGKDIWIHRKGATSIDENTLGIIPGSQGTASYIVSGTNSELSYHSCSHGAGRKLSRTKAKENLDLDTEIEKLNQLGIIHSISKKKDLDEAPGAYKDIDDVLLNQTDLVTIKTKLTPIAVVKGN